MAHPLRVEPVRGWTCCQLQSPLFDYFWRGQAPPEAGDVQTSRKARAVAAWGTPQQVGRGRGLSLLLTTVRGTMEETARLLRLKEHAASRMEGGFVPSCQSNEHSLKLP